MRISLISIKYAYVEDNKIIGVVLGKKEVTNSIPILKPRIIYFIDDIVVDKNFRHKGIGKKLYNYVLDKAKDNKVDSIKLTVWAFNRDAVNFYKSLGMNEKNIRFEQKIK